MLGYVGPWPVIGPPAAVCRPRLQRSGLGEFVLQGLDGSGVVSETRLTLDASCQIQSDEVLVCHGVDYAVFPLTMSWGLYRVERGNDAHLLLEDLVATTQRGGCAL